MNILFLTLAEITNIDQGGIYPDLMKFFVEQGHHVSILSPIERRHKVASSITEHEGYRVIRVKTLNIQKTNLVEKALGTVSLDYLFSKAVKSMPELDNIDILLYSTPPITFVKTIATIKKRFNPFTYLLLKDIFPQNAVDLDFMKKGGLIYKYFRKKEKYLYDLSDGIGCMSPANVEYVRKHNPTVNPNKVEVCPNSIIPQKSVISQARKVEIRREFGLPIDKTIFIYGGNLGKPQGVDFIIKFLESQILNEKAYYIIAGSGTEYAKLRLWVDQNGADNIELHPYLPKVDYDKILKCADVGMIFLDNRFTIPNYPSRLLAYLDNEIPILSAVDVHTDIGEVIEKEELGKNCISGDLTGLNQNVEYFCSLTQKQLDIYRKNTRNYLLNNDTVTHSVKVVMDAYNSFIKSKKKY